MLHVARLVARGHDEGAQGASACGRCQNRCAPLAPQALETGDFGIVVPIVFISLRMVPIVFIPAIFRNSWQHGRR